MQIINSWKVIHATLPRTSGLRVAVCPLWYTSSVYC